MKRRIQIQTHRLRLRPRAHLWSFDPMNLEKAQGST